VILHAQLGAAMRIVEGAHDARIPASLRVYSAVALKALFFVHVLPYAPIDLSLPALNVIFVGSATRRWLAFCTRLYFWHLQQPWLMFTQGKQYTITLLR
jgi:hypothetical protein